MLTVSQLSYQLDNHRLFVDMSWQAKPGDVVQLLGHNGAGKSTLMNMLAGFVRPSSGTIHWEKIPLWDVILPCYLSHQLGLSESLTVSENLYWMGVLQGCSLNTQKLQALLSTLGLNAYSAHFPSELSRGLQQRLALARFYMSNSPLWLMDEPATGLDQAGSDLLIDMIECYQSRGGLVILTSHQELPITQTRPLHLQDWQTEASIQMGARW